MPWNSIAPTSKCVVLAGSGRGLPKKSMVSWDIVAVGRLVALSGT